MPLWLCFLLAATFAAILVSTAWVCDDAYITLRVVDNVRNGLGPTWNAGERVQAFTHPLWMLLLSAASGLPCDLYFVTVFLSLALSLATAALVLLHLRGRSWAALFAVSALCLSKSFTDYSTSGLENPLTHLLLAGFVVLYLRNPGSPPWGALCLLAGLLALTRMDQILLVLPFLAVEGVRRGGRRAWRGLALGFLPFLLWEAFALIFYGSPFPNTAFAKMNLEIPRSEMVLQGLQYLLDSLKEDPVTLPVVAAALVLSVRSRQRASWTLLAGVVLYVAYVVWIGGDFMSGRFLSGAFLAALLVLASQGRPVPAAAAALLVLFVLGFAGPHPPPLSTRDYRVAEFQRDVDYILSEVTTAPRGINDHRGSMYLYTGLLRIATAPRTGAIPFPEHPWAYPGWALRRRGGKKVVVYSAVGLFGYFCGPDVYVLDRYALGDPLLARLPYPASENWKVGHYARRIPAGYEESLESGENRLADPELRRFYDVLVKVVRGPLFSADRLREIVKLNLGLYDDWVDRTDYL